MRGARSQIVIVAVLAAAGCGGAVPDFEVNGAAIYVDTAAPFAQQPGFPGRLESTIEVALEYWGGDWTSLQGRSITLGGDYVSCNGHDKALGCYDGDIRVATADPGMGTFHCVEQTVLVHEVGHAVIGDRLHEDPRWMQFEEVAEALADRVGWDAAGEVDCGLFPSVWRHLHGRP